MHEDTVEIHGVFHGGQDYETDLSDRHASPASKSVGGAAAAPITGLP